MKNKIECKSCDDTGHVTMYEKINGAAYAFQCICDKGANHASYPSQYENMSETYSSHRAWSVGRFDRSKTQANKVVLVN